MPALPEETLAYERHMTGKAIRSIQAMLAKQPPTAKSREYYEMMEQCFIALEEAMRRFDELDANLNPSPLSGSPG